MSIIRSSLIFVINWNSIFCHPGRHSAGEQINMSFKQLSIHLSKKRRNTSRRRFVGESANPSKRRREGQEGEENNNLLRLTVSVTNRKHLLRLDLNPCPQSSFRRPSAMKWLGISSPGDFAHHPTDTPDPTWWISTWGVRELPRGFRFHSAAI